MTEAHSDSGSILVLDDEPMVTTSLGGLLGMETSWEIATFNRPSEAIESLDARRYGAVISDFLMPEMDGIEFLRRVREIQPFASRILLTGYADKQNAIRSINEAGLYHYIEKPWDNAELLLVLRNGMERSNLLVQLDEKVRRLGENDQSMEALRSRLLKAIL
jgi:response regulator RpfG family c-di-GMP phosphodiesterase